MTHFLQWTLKKLCFTCFFATLVNEKLKICCVGGETTPSTPGSRSFQTSTRLFWWVEIFFSCKCNSPRKCHRMSSVWKLHLYCSLFLSFLDLQASLKWWHGEMPRQFRETEMPKCLGPRCWAYKKTLQHWLTAFATASTWNFVKSWFTVSRYQESYDSERGHDCYESGQIAMENSHNSSFSRKTLGECNLQLLILRNLNPSPFRVHKLSHPWRAVCLKKEAISCPHTPWLLTIQYQPDQPFPDTFLRCLTPLMFCRSNKNAGVFMHRFRWCLMFGKLNEKLLKGGLWDGILRNTWIWSCKHFLFLGKLALNMFF